MSSPSICGLVVEYFVAIEVTRVRFPANARLLVPCGPAVPETCARSTYRWVKSEKVLQSPRDVSRRLAVRLPDEMAEWPKALGSAVVRKGVG